MGKFCSHCQIRDVRKGPSLFQECSSWQRVNTNQQGSWVTPCSGNLHLCSHVPNNGLRLLRFLKQTGPVLRELPQNGKMRVALVSSKDDQPLLWAVLPHSDVESEEKSNQQIVFLSSPTALLFSGRWSTYNPRGGHAKLTDLQGPGHDPREAPGLIRSNSGTLLEDLHRSDQDALHVAQTLLYDVA